MTTKITASRYRIDVAPGPQAAATKAPAPGSAEAALKAATSAEAVAGRAVSAPPKGAAPPPLPLDRQADVPEGSPEPAAMAVDHLARAAATVEDRAQAVLDLVDRSSDARPLAAMAEEDAETAQDRARSAALAALAADAMDEDPVPTRRDAMAAPLEDAPLPADDSATDIAEDLPVQRLSRSQRAQQRDAERRAAQAAEQALEADLAAIRQEGLTGRQLRLARRTAQRHGLAFRSDHDAVRQLRVAGIDPFLSSNLIDLVAGDTEALADGGTDPLLDAPEAPPVPAPASGGGSSRALTAMPEGASRVPAKRPPQARQNEAAQLAEVRKIQRDILRRRRRRAALLFGRLLFFVGLPGLLAGWYFYVVATPLFSTRSEFVIQQATPSGAAGGGLGSLFSGTQFATAQDSIAVQGYLQSRDAMLRLDEDQGFRAHFSEPGIDALQRLEPDGSSEAAYKTYRRNVKISYDPTEGLVRLEVSATDPASSVKFAEALIGYAEEQVDHLTQRLREDQMKGARDSYDEAEAQMLAAQRKLVELQERFKVLSSEMELTLIGQQIAGLENQLTQERLSLAQMESNENPNEARMEPVKRRVATLEDEIAALRSRLTEEDAAGQSLARVQSELLVAQADVQTRQLLLAQALQQMETARIEANRQVRYLSLSVNPVAPDEPSYPRAFENTAVALMIFAGIYLMISMTSAILREQMTA